MSLYYVTQNNRDLIGSSSSEVTLTAVYSDNTAKRVTESMDQANFYIWYTPAQNGRVISIKIESSGDNTDFVTKTTDVISASTGAGTLFQKEDSFTGATATTQYGIIINHNLADKFTRISVKEDGSSSFGTVFIQYSFSGK